MISTFIAQVFCALKSYVHFYFILFIFAAPRAVVSVFGAETQTLRQKQKQGLRHGLA